LPIGLLATFFAWVSLSLCEAAAPIIPIYEEGNTFGNYLDANGYVAPIFHLIQVQFGESFTLPLSVNFSSAIRPPSPEFGQGWECPLFDAKIVDVQQNEKKVETLGGKTLFLIYDPRTNCWKHFYSNHWSGQVKGPDFVLSYDNAWTFTYHNGLISSLTSPGGRVIHWNRDGEKVVSLSEEGKEPSLEMVYDKLGFAKQIVLGPDHAGLSSVNFNFTADLIYAGISKIEGFQGRVINLDRTTDKKLNPILNLSDTRGPGAKLMWDAKTGKILSDGRYSYSIAEVSSDRTYPRMSRTSLVDGKTETFYFDEKHGTTDQTLADGTIRHIEMIVAPGPNYKAIRLVQETRHGKTVDILRRAFDDHGNTILDSSTLPSGIHMVKQYTYDNANRAVSYIFNGKEIWHNIYDPQTGDLRERDLISQNVKIAFDSLPGGEVNESIEKKDGGIISRQTLDENAWQKQCASLEKFY